MFNATDEQQTIFAAIKNGQNISVQAAPGSGKTTTISQALNNLGKSSIALAYNRKAADDLRQKATGYYAFTFHQIGNALCWANRSGSITISKDKYKFILMPLLKNYYATNEKSFWKHLENILNIFDMYRSYGDLTKTFDDIAQMFGYQMFPFYNAVLQEMLERGVKSYTHQKGKTELDQTDTVFLSQYLDLSFKKGDKIGNKEYQVPFGTFDTIAADECNDLTYNYIHLMKKLNPNAQMICIGDPNQAINQWAGALDNSFEVVEETFGTTRLKLSTVFRCPSNHVDYLNRKYEDFGYLTAVKEPGILESILEEDIPLYVDDNTAIIFRNQRGKKSPAWGVFIMLLNADIPANIAGMGFPQIVRRIIKKVTANSEIEIKFTELAHEVWQASVNDLNPNYADYQDEKSEYDLTKALLEYSYAKGVKSGEGFFDFINYYTKTDGPVLTTGHKTKGLEFGKTIVFPLPELKRPTPQTILAEKRLNYVMDSRSTSAMYFVE